VHAGEQRLPLFGLPYPFLLFCALPYSEWFDTSISVFKSSEWRTLLYIFKPKQKSTFLG